MSLSYVESLSSHLEERKDQFIHTTSHGVSSQEPRAKVSKLGQIGPKWDNSGTFKDQF